MKENPEIIIHSLELLKELFRKQAKPYAKESSPRVNVTIIKEERPSSFKKYTYEGPESSFGQFIEYMKKENE